MADRLASSSATESVTSAALWLDNLPGGASVTEFVGRLHAEEGERVGAALLEIRRLTNEESKYMNSARNVEVCAGVFGILGLVVIHATLERRFGGHFVLAIDAALVAATWWVARQWIKRQLARAHHAYLNRQRLRDETFTRVGVLYDDTLGVVYSKTRLQSLKKQMEENLEVNQAVFDQIVRGGELALKAGVDPNLLLHRKYLLNNVLGGLPTEELLEHPDCARLFHEMSELGLNQQTAEAILVSKMSEELPLSERTLAVAKSRMASVDPF